MQHLTPNECKQVCEYLKVASDALRQFATDAYMNRRALHLQRRLEAYADTAIELRDKLST